MGEMKGKEEERRESKRRWIGRRKIEEGEVKSEEDNNRVEEGEGGRGRAREDRKEGGK